ncbi:MULTISPECIES: molybdopterin molybdotransferase MoeA [unclassified Campylobacter]|uniref:molybdopterin molybdotransferase MoeA n=1 Tax=unclassified Campylobacter TaxID=2593542 RepID=UPI0022E9F716|nr:MULTISPECIES: molybdopterin molybdotransferase MoeA [unclassified Campylobacter]MDA3061561.1 molybdopterin molybdotransferase MoeA [Campylobacter sp. JMF_14 EL1]MDA3073333.1 molybdopterin molybdotransferase MoeA [Campylobacter sp. JMF_10 EL2]
MIDINTALELIFRQNLGLFGEKKIEISRSLGAILAQDIKARKNVPSFDNSALDGYAYNSEKIGESLQIVEPTIFAGDQKFYEISPNQAQKIMTGAPMPKGANSVLRVEDAYIKDGFLQIPAIAKAGDGLRKMGEEVREGEVLLSAGERINAAKIMLLAAQGINEIPVRTTPKIAVLSSGDELKEPWESANEREIYNANASGICALLQSENFANDYLGIIKDEADAVREALKNAAQSYDVIITSGGASMGEADFMAQILCELGFSPVFEHIDIKPGKPIKCYHAGKKLVFVMPGNPLAAFILAKIIILPVLKKMVGENFKAREILAKFNGELKFRPNRINLSLGVYENGYFTPIKSNSAMIKPLCGATHFMLSKFEQCEQKNGEIVKIYEI